MDKLIRQNQWDQLFMFFSSDVANMSHAIRLKVGAVAVRDKRVIAIGYNGTPPGESNVCEELDELGNLKTKSNVIHAEANLIRFAKEHNINLTGCKLYLTHSPCPNCGQLLIEAGITEVMFGKHYRITKDLSKLTEAGLIVSEYN